MTKTDPVRTKKAKALGNTKTVSPIQELKKMLGLDGSQLVALRDDLEKARQEYDFRKTLEYSHKPHTIRSIFTKDSVKKIAAVEKAIRLIAQTLDSKSPWALAVSHSIKDRPPSGETFFSMNSWVKATKALASEGLKPQFPRELESHLGLLNNLAKDSTNEAYDDLTAMEWLAGLQIPLIYQRYANVHLNKKLPKSRKQGTSDTGKVKFVRLAILAVQLPALTPSSVATHISQATMKKQSACSRKKLPAKS